MTSNNHGQYSPLYRRTTAFEFSTQNRWTVDNSESRFHSLTQPQQVKSL